MNTRVPTSHSPVVAAESAAQAALNEMVRLDTADTRRRFFDALLASELHVTLMDGPELTARAIRLTDGSLALPVFLDKTAMQSWAKKPTRSATWFGQPLFQMAVDMGVDAVVVNAAGPALQINRSSIALLARGVNPTSVPPAKEKR